MNNDWVNTIGTQHFSVHGESHTTNNAVEGLHSQLVRRMGPHPSVWDFHEQLRDIETDQFHDLIRLRNNVQIVRATPRVQTQHERNLFQANTLLAQGRYNVAQFLSRISHISTNLATLMDRGPRADAREEVFHHRPEHMAAELTMPPIAQQNLVEDVNEVPQQPQQPPFGPIRQRRRRRRVRLMLYAPPAIDAQPQPMDAPPAMDVAPPVVLNEHIHIGIGIEQCQRPIGQGEISCRM